MGNGVVWTGHKDKTTQAVQGVPGENELSLGLLIHYGDFRYFTGGDIGGVDEFGETDKNSIESYIAPRIGEVDIATLNHHGNRGSSNKAYVSILKARIWIMQSWSSDHPGEEVLRRLISKNLYPSKRALFATSLLTATKNYIGPKVEKAFEKETGHIVVRVYPPGNLYSIFVLDDKHTNYHIISQHGPYLTKQLKNRKSTHWAHNKHPKSKVY